MPFLKNFNGKSPMNLLSDNVDYRSMNMMLEYLSGYGIDHHSRAIVDIFPACI
jgi:hypothetical protein